MKGIGSSLELGASADSILLVISWKSHPIKWRYLSTSWANSTPHYIVHNIFLHHITWQYHTTPRNHIAPHHTLHNNIPPYHTIQHHHTVPHHTTPTTPTNAVIWIGLDWLLLYRDGSRRIGNSILTSVPSVLYLATVKQKITRPRLMSSNVVAVLPFDSTLTGILVVYSLVPRKCHHSDKAEFQSPSCIEMHLLNKEILIKFHPSNRPTNPISLPT